MFSLCLFGTLRRYKITQYLGYFQKNSPNKEQKTTLRLQQLNSQRITSLHAHGDCPRVHAASRRRPRGFRWRFLLSGNSLSSSSSMSE